MSCPSATVGLSRLFVVAAPGFALLAPGRALAAPSDEPVVVSRQSATAGGMPADRDAGGADVSADGRYVAFESKARNLSPIAAEVMNVYLYDTKRKRIELVSRNGRKGANGKSQDPAVSQNGRYVAFGSRAGNLPGPAKEPNVYVYDAKRNRVELVSRQSHRTEGVPPMPGRRTPTSPPTATSSRSRPPPEPRRPDRQPKERLRV